MSTHLVSTGTLDQVLALQFLVAWAGEGQSEPPRLGWWRTDLVDELGGGDFFRRLAPRTHRWAALEGARRAAFLADKKARALMPDADAVRTLFFWGFELDELLAERLRDLKLQEKDLEDGSFERLDPTRVLPFPEGLRPGSPFDKARLEKVLQALAPGASFQALPAGRQVAGAYPSTDPVRAARTLAACLVPLGPGYLPSYYRL